MDCQGRIFGIDYGQKRIGVAVSDPSCTVAQGLPTIVYKSLPEALTKLDTFVEAYEVRRFVVGVPLTMKGEVGFAAKKVARFAEALEARYSVPVISRDERFTSVAAARTIMESGKKPSRNKAKIDELAARFILQDYLDELKRCYD